MKSKIWIFSVFFLATAAWASADPLVESIQQKLKDQGFYYGEISGKKDADTVAAIRRYQIRNGLQITGELDAQTQRSLGVSAAATPRATVRSTPIPTPKPSTFPSAPSVPREQTLSQIPRDPEEEEEPAGAYVPGPRGLRPETTGIFDGTPFEVAPPDVQRRVLIGAQTILARRGYYRSGIDGVYGPGMAFAVRAYQARIGVAPTGQLDLETLASLGLLPGERAPDFGRRHFLGPRREPAGERIYIPN